MEGGKTLGNRPQILERLSGLLKIVSSNLGA